jgi:hypothetical protein
MLSSELYASRQDSSSKNSYFARLQRQAASRRKILLSLDRIWSNIVFQLDHEVSMQSRRRFLAASAATLAAAALPTGILAEQLGANVFTNASLGAYTQGLLTQANFTSVTGSVFTASLPDGSYRYLTLRSVAAAPVSSRTTNAAPRSVAAPKITLNTSVQVSSFALVFDVQGDAIPQGSYLLDHGTLGSFVIFLVQGQTPAGTPTCVATFASLDSMPVNPAGPRSTSYTTPVPTLARPMILVP